MSDVIGMDPVTKLEIAKQKKQVADQAFKTGDIPSALRSYHEAMMYLHGLDKNLLSTMSGMGNQPKPSLNPTENEKEPPSEVDLLLGTIYSNQAACHMKNLNWKRVLECTDKALAKNPQNYKAQFRKGKAQAEVGYIEKAISTLEDLLTKAKPGGEKAVGTDVDKASVLAELARIRAVDKEREKKHNQKFKGFLNKKPGPPSASLAPPSPTSSASSIPSTAPSSTASTVSITSTVLPPSGLQEVTDEDIARELKKGEESGDANAPIDLT